MVVCKIHSCLDAINLLAMYLTYANGFIPYNQSSIVIHHENYASSVRSIIIRGTGIAKLHCREFQRYEDLTQVLLGKNKINDICATAFQGTKAQFLSLNYNALTEFPNLSVIGETLVSLHLDVNKISIVAASHLQYLTALSNLVLNLNPLTQYPDVSTLNSGKKISLYLDNVNIQNLIIPSSYCEKVRSLYLSGSGKDIPNILCNRESTSIEKMELRKRNIRWDSDFSGLDSITGSLFFLKLSDHAMMRFPQLTLLLKHNLRKLSLHNCGITEILKNEIKDFHSLVHIDLSSNPLVTISPYLFQIVTSLGLRNLIDKQLNMSEELWRKNLCNVKDGFQIDLHGSLHSLAFFPPLKDLLCRSDKQIKFIFTSITNPCDCSIDWMNGLEECNVQIESNSCILQETACPNSFVMFYDSIETSGKSKMFAEEASTLDIEFEINALVIRGQHSWKLKFGESHAFLKAGGYTNFQDISFLSKSDKSNDFILNIDELHLGISSDICRVSPNLGYLHDKNTNSCVKFWAKKEVLIYRGPRDTVRTIQLRIHTQQINCSDGFYVMPYVLKRQKSGNGLCKKKCDLLRSEMNFSVMYCNFGCSSPHDESFDFIDQIFIQITGVSDGFLCEVDVK